MDSLFGSITLAQLINFQMLAETKHFTEAARRLYITQPTLSTSIKSLERELGVSLVLREGRRNVRLTVYGEEFLAYVNRALGALNEGVRQVRIASGIHDKVLRIGTIPTVQYDFLPLVLKRFWGARGHSDVKIEMAVEFSNPLIEGLKSQAYDVILSARVPEEIQDVEFCTVLTKSLVAVVHRRGPFADRTSFSLAELRAGADNAFASYRPGTPIGQEVRALFDEHGISPSVVLDDEFTLCSYVISNRDRVGIMLDTHAIDVFNDDVLVLPLDEVPSDFHSICIGYDKRVLLSKQAEDFVGIAREVAAEFLS